MFFKEILYNHIELMNIKYYLAGIFTVVFIVVVVAGGYLLGKGNLKESKDTAPATSEITLTVPRDTREIPGGNPTQPVDLTKVISTAVGNKDYSELERYFTNPVSVRIEATECCQPQNPTGAIEELAYVESATGPWNFNQQSEIVAALQASYPEHYGGAIIGISQDNYLVAFQLNEENKISKISMAVDYELLVP
ncbi:MAG: hypothetical protein ACC618_01590 [Patescibacteria group bacterium]